MKLDRYQQIGVVFANLQLGQAVPAFTTLIGYFDAGHTLTEKARDGISEMLARETTSVRQLESALLPASAPCLCSLPLLPAPCSLLPAHCSLLTACCSMLAAHCSLRPALHASARWTRPTSSSSNASRMGSPSHSQPST